MARTLDSNANEVSLADLATEQFELKAVTADKITTTIDDGADGAPASHDYVLETWVPAEGVWMHMHSASASTAQYHSHLITPPKVRVTIKNVSGAQATFRFSTTAMQGEIR